MNPTDDTNGRNETNPHVIDAEFVDVPGERGERPPEGYGRGTRVEAAGAVGGGLVDATVGLLDAAGPIAQAVAQAAGAAGAEEVARRAQRAAELSGHVANVVREVPKAAAAVERETRPLRAAWGKLAKAAKESGVVGERRAPRVAVRTVRAAKGKAKSEENANAEKRSHESHE